ncbi:MAG: hypothetical protein QM686_22660 [Herbaspirillum sp.]
MFARSKNISLCAGSSPVLVFMGSLLFFLLGITHVVAAKAKVPAPELVKDIMTATNPEGSYPDEFCSIGDTIYFTAQTKTYGRELWKSNGTSKGTVLVKDILPGRDSSFPEHLLNYKGTLYFSVGPNLWKSNGTAESTVLIHKGENYNYIHHISIIGEMIYFISSYQNFESNIIFWKSDGTTEGTACIADVPNSIINTPPIKVGENLYFLTLDQSYHSKLWKLDSTTGTLSMLKNLTPRWNFEQLSEVAAGNGLFWFHLYNPSIGYELWRSDGTEEGTFKLSSITSAQENICCIFSEKAQLLYFFGGTSPSNQGLWKSDGTVQGTTLVKKIIADESSGEIQAFAEIGNSIFFVSYIDEILQLWTSDGSEANTRVSFNFPEIFQNAEEISSINNQIYLILRTTEEKEELWKVIPRASGKLEAGKVRGPNQTGYLSLAALKNGSILFAAGDSIHSTELWSSRSADFNSIFLKDLQGGSASSDPHELQALNGSLIFSATSAGKGDELWRTNGKKSGTTLVKEIQNGPVGSNASHFTVIGNNAYFSAFALNTSGSGSYQLWKTNGQTKGTSLLETFNIEESYPPSNFTNLSEKLYFTTTSTYDNSLTLYKKEEYLQELDRRIASVSPQSLIKSGEFIYYINDQAELWKTNGTSQGTLLLKNLGPNLDSIYFTDFVAHEGMVYVILHTYSGIHELWRSDGTPEGTVILKSLQITEEDSGDITGLTPAGTSLYFTVQTLDSSIELWKTDGNSEGTSLVKNIGFPHSGDFINAPCAIIANGNNLYFRASEEGIYTLWKTDGTSEGTLKILDFDPGSEGIIYHDKLYFAANDGTHGHELWVSDGTTSGTRMVYDLTGDSGSAVVSNPEDWRILGDKLYFTATTEKFGNELYVYDDLARKQAVYSETPSPETLKLKQILDEWLSFSRRR